MFRLTQILENPHEYLAHTHHKKEDETLQQHIDLTFSYYQKLEEEKNINAILDRALEEFYYINKKKEEVLLSPEARKIIKYLFESAIYSHDLGKINVAFQKAKMKNKAFENIKTTSDTYHSKLSSLMYIDIYYDQIKNNELEKLDRIEKNVVLLFLFSFSYSISRHHSYLINLTEYKNELIALIASIEENNEKILNYKEPKRLIERKQILCNDNKAGIYKQLETNIKKYIKSGDTFYIIGKILYGLIITCDYYATTDYMNQPIKHFGNINNIHTIYESFDQSEILSGIRQYSNYKNGLIENSPFPKGSINNLRSDIFLESEKTLKDNLEKNMFYLEAPTGSGKTINSLNLALSIVNHNQYQKVFYVFPFNTLCDQTYSVITKYVPREQVAIVNSIKPIKVSEADEEENIDYDKAYTDRLFLHYPYVITSHVNFFNYLFSVGRESQIPLIHLANSVVILDEIQSYKVKIWKELANMMDMYSKVLNIKFIIMSATLPRLSVLNTKENLGVALMKNPQKYFGHEKFRERVKPNFALLSEKKIDLKHLAEKVLEVREEVGESRILIEFIKKKTAREFYNILLEKGYAKEKLFELTGDDNPMYRNHLLGKIKEKNEDKYTLDDVIVVCTQVIEAGVDIDMDIGFKDISIIESEEQYFGRINRSGTKINSTVYFFNYDDEKNIYRDDYRTMYTVREEKYRQILLTKDFNAYYQELLGFINKKKTQSNENAYLIHEDNLKYLKYKEIYESLRLIDTVTYTVYMAHKLKNPITNQIIDGEEIWEQFKSILKDMSISYTEKQILLSQIKEKMNYFIYQMYQQPIFTDDSDIEDIYYIKDGEQYFDGDGKFNRELFQDKVTSKTKADVIL